MNHGQIHPQEYLGPIKHRGRFFLKLEKRLTFPTFTIHILVNRHGKEATFYNIKNENDVTIDEGDCIAVTATVAKHKKYKGKPQTYLNRVILIEIKGKANVV